MNKNICFLKSLLRKSKTQFWHSWWNFSARKCHKIFAQSQKLSLILKKKFQKKDFVSEYSAANANIEYSFHNAAKKIFTESLAIFCMLSRNKFESMSLEKSVFSSKYSSGREN